MPFDPASQLRARARHLRDLAVRIERTPALRLDGWADVDTWRGPRADECRRLLHDAQHRYHAAADDLRRQAWQLERRADELDTVRRALGVAG